MHLITIMSKKIRQKLSELNGKINLQSVIDRRSRPKKTVEREKI